MSELLEKILDRDNMNAAYKRVCANKGAGGIDGVKVEELSDYIKENWGSIFPVPPRANGWQPCGEILGTVAGGNYKLRSQKNLKNFPSLSILMNLFCIYCKRQLKLKFNI